MNSFEINQENINHLIEISRLAGESIMKIYETDFDINIKNDSSPLTKADLASHKIITSKLRKITPNIPILSEESSDIKYKERSKWNKYWLVDPLDGTKEFINKNGEFTTNIALIFNNRPIFGIIHVPASDETYWGSKKIGSYYLNGDSLYNKKKISVSKNRKNKLRIVTSRSHSNPILGQFIKKINDCELINIGSSLKFCLVAKGEADFYPRLGPTSEWDTAAGEIIAISAGAKVVDAEDNLLKYNSKEDYINPNFLVCNENALTIKHLFQ